MSIHNVTFGKRNTDINNQNHENLEHTRFHMSFRFDNTKPDDFGLISSEQDNVYIDPNDNSKWEKRNLIDLGWGLEVAFCKLPYPSFNELLHLSLYANSKEKKAGYYCSIGLLLHDYASEFFDFTQNILANGKYSLQDHKHFYSIVRTQMIYLDKIMKVKWEVIFDQYKELM